MGSVGYTVNPTMTPQGVEQLPSQRETGVGKAVNPTMTPQGVEQTADEYDRLRITDV